jgi:hypothetical protein
MSEKNPYDPIWKDKTKPGSSSEPPRVIEPRKRRSRYMDGPPDEGVASIDITAQVYGTRIH